MASQLVELYRFLFQPTVMVRLRTASMADCRLPLCKTVSDAICRSSQVQRQSCDILDVLLHRKSSGRWTLEDADPLCVSVIVTIAPRRSSNIDLLIISFAPWKSSFASDLAPKHHLQSDLDATDILNHHLAHQRTSHVRGLPSAVLRQQLAVFLVRLDAHPDSLSLHVRSPEPMRRSVDSARVPVPNFISTRSSAAPYAQQLAASLYSHGSRSYMPSTLARRLRS